MTDTEYLSCQELVELVTDYLEGALPPVELARFEAHIAACDGCARYLEQIRETVRLTGTLTVDDLTPQAESTLVEAFRSWGQQSAPTAPDS
jgi:anti-sigma factor RsiW